MCKEDSKREFCVMGDKEEGIFIFIDKMSKISGENLT